jgi:predicted nucleic acid-binding protein
MIFLDTDILSYLLAEDTSVRNKVDIMIAAIVTKNNGTLVSNNTKHYEDIEQLKLVNWV